MGRIFSPPKPPAPPPAPVVATRASSAGEISAAAEEDKQKRQKQLGRAATLLSGRQGILGDEDVGGASSSAGLATKKLLGA